MSLENLFTIPSSVGVSSAAGEKGGLGRMSTAIWFEVNIVAQADESVNAAGVRGLYWGGKV